MCFFLEGTPVRGYRPPPFRILTPGRIGLVSGDPAGEEEEDSLCGITPKNSDLVELWLPVQLSGSTPEQAGFTQHRPTAVYLRAS